MTRCLAVTAKIDLETEECCNCFIVFAMPKSLIALRRQDGQRFHCPNGHSMSYTGNENRRLKQKVEELEQKVSAKAEQARIAEESRRKTEAKMKRLKNRTSKGVCPCCNRSFAALQQHIKTKHPDFAETK